MSSKPSSHFERELHQQPSLLERKLIRDRSRVVEIASLIKQFSPRHVVIAGRGSSDNAARYAQYLFGVRHQLSVGLAAPSIHTLYNSSPDLSGALVLGISQSGESPDVIQVLNDARAQGAFTLGITNDENSGLAAAAEYCLPLMVGTEKSVAASKTYTSQLLTMAMVSAGMSEQDMSWNELDEVPSAMFEALEQSTHLLDDGSVRRLNLEGHVLIVGRGYNLSTASELALKIQEMTYRLAHAYSSADFRHGPIALVEQSTIVIVVAPSGVTNADLADLVSSVSEFGATVVMISDDKSLLAEATLPLILPKRVAEWVSPIVSVLPGQLLSLKLAQSSGLDPDAPRGLTKVTRTN